jgi:beta-galactosidase
MKRFLLCCALALASLPLSAAQSPHSFSTDGDHFVLDGHPFKILSGELHYARIPREYWHGRLKMAKAMGLNTVATYVFWNVHEPEPGRYDFSGNNDLAAFIKAAQEEGLYVILRAGPYSCAEWEFGGFPAWLLNNGTKDGANNGSKNAVILTLSNAKGKNPRISPEAPTNSPETTNTSDFPLRSNDPAFMVPTERWIHRLGQEVASLQIGHGGPILMTQVENEYGNFGSDHTYMEHLQEIFKQAGFTASLLYTADNWRNIDKGSIPSLPAATNFGIGNHQGGMDALAKLRPDGPLFVSEYWPGWFDHWGHPHETRPVAPQVEDLDYILHRGAGINIYMLHGGTSFGFMAGSSWTNNQFLPDVTSYDYDAPLDEAGHPTPKYFAYRKVLAKYACGKNSNVIPSGAQSAESRNPRILPGPAQISQDNEKSESCLPSVPTPPPGISIPQITLTESTPLWQNLPTPITADQPQSMEQYGQSYGYILYRTQLPAAVAGDLVLNELHDYAQIYLDGKLIGTLDRRNKQNSLPLTTSGPTRLDILVANDGRINSTRMMRTEQKGITQSATLGGRPLTSWQVFPLPTTSLPSKFARADKNGVILRGVDGPTVSAANSAPTFFRAHFTLTQAGDTFLDIRNLGKGALWINGHPIGRFWNIGPQQTLYVPGPWLRKGVNEIVIFDLAPTSPQPYVAGLDHPIIDGPVSDKTGSKQE